jgi:hypothetical protein
MWSYTHTYIYIHKYTERENNVVLVGLSERTTRGGARGKENVRE